MTLSVSSVVLCRENCKSIQGVYWCLLTGFSSPEKNWRVSVNESGQCNENIWNSTVMVN